MGRHHRCVVNPPESPVCCSGRALRSRSDGGGAPCGRWVASTGMGPVLVGTPTRGRDGIIPSSACPCVDDARPEKEVGMPAHDIIVIGASAGGMDALQNLVRGLPPDLPAALFVVWHIPAHSVGVLPDVLTRAGPLPAAHARDGEPIEPGRIYVAPPDRHLVLEPGRVRLTHGPKENHFRPAVDPLFRSAAVAYGPRVIGVMLSGALNDGTAGMWAIKDRGGLTVVQEPDEALYPSMPTSVLEYVAVDERRPSALLGPVLAQLVHTAADETGGTPVSEDLHLETRIALEDNALELGVTQLGTPSFYTCPECHGVLIQLHGGAPLRFRCPTGHAFTADALQAHTAEVIEDHLWSVVRAMDEHVLLLTQIADQFHAAGKDGAAHRLRAQVRVAKQQTQTIRQVALQQQVPDPIQDTDGDPAVQ
jgi:two-component system chemotaxis response regulator CheB